MAEPISIQQLKDASLDVKSLEEVVNGNDTKQVATRLGESYPSVKKAIKTLFGNGGLPATPFLTKAKMETEGASLADGQLAMVYNETTNNGLYVKTAGTWVKASYDPVNQSKEYVDGRLLAELTPFIGSTAAENILDLLDSLGRNVLFVDSMGGLNLNGLGGSVQKTIAELKVQTQPISSTENEDIFLLVDSVQSPVVRVDSKGLLYINGLDEPVQHLVSLDNNKDIQDIKDTLKAKSYSKKETDKKDKPLTAPFISVLALNRPYFQNVSPLPEYAAAQDFTIGEAWINSVRFQTQVPSDRVVIAGYEPQFANDIGVVHPQVWSFKEKVAGYKYWLGLNPYTNQKSSIELPFIYGSNDPELKTWELIPKFPQPFFKDPEVTGLVMESSHLSDSGFVYDPINSNLVFFWRETLYYNEPTGVRGTNTLWGSAFDGVAWSEPFIMKPETNITGDYLISPNILFNPSDMFFYMYYIESNKLYYRTAKRLDGAWSERTACGILGADIKCWHLCVKFVGNKLVILVHVDSTMSGVTTDSLHFGVSSDFKNFNISGTTILTNADPKVYKSTFLPVFVDDNNVKFKIITTTDENTLPMFQMYVAETNTINIGV